MSRARRKKRQYRHPKQVPHPVQIQLREILIVMTFVAVLAAAISQWSSHWPEEQQRRFLLLVVFLSVAAGMVILVGFMRRYHALRKAGGFVTSITANLNVLGRRTVLVLNVSFATMGGILLVILALTYSSPERAFNRHEIITFILLFMFGLSYVHVAAWHLPWLLVSMEVYEKGLVVGPWRFIRYESIRDHNWTIGNSEGMELHLRNERVVRIHLPRSDRSFIEKYLRTKD